MGKDQNLQGQSRLISEVLDKGLCVRCGACVGLCPYFNYFDGQVIVMDRCQAETWRCLQLCPRIDYDKASLKKIVGMGEEDSPIGKTVDIFAARSTNQEVLQKAQYGGVVTSLMIYLLKKGRINAAVMTDRGNEFSPKGFICVKEEEILACSGSRYSASGTLSVLNQAINENREKLGVVGLPCQMEALARMEEMEPDGKERANKISLKIGLFCTWALDFRALKQYLAQKGISEKPKKFDIPPPPSEIFIVETDSGNMEFPLSDIRPLVQKGCSLCDDMTAEFCDISVGTLEGKDGWNTVIVRTEAGSRVIESALEQGIIEKADIPLQNLEHLKEAASNKKQRAMEARREAK